MVIHQFTTSGPNPPFAEMRMSSYNDYCSDCADEGIEPIIWGDFKRLVGELIAVRKYSPAAACMYAQKVAFDRFHSN